MSCEGCIFKGFYQDMGASCDTCKLHDYLPDAIKACDNSKNCPHRVPLKEAKKKLLSPDVVEVVRCKDCKHYGGITFGGLCRKYSGSDTKVCTEKDHYCSYGERREDGN